MAKLTEAQTTVTQRIGTRLARKLFEDRGNHTEAHLKEEELAEWFRGAAELGIIACTTPVMECTAEQRRIMDREPLGVK